MELAGVTSHHTDMNKNYYPQHWPWILSAYLGEGLPYAIVNTLMVALLADMGMSNGSVAAITGMLSIPWSLKFLWSPLVDSISTKRRWMMLMEAGLAIVFLATSLSLSSGIWQYAVTIFAATAAILSATYDISCDGFYMKALSQDAQSFFVGIRNMAYRMGWLLATGALVWVTGRFEMSGFSTTTSWQLTFGIIASLFFLLYIGYQFMLPKVETENKGVVKTGIMGDVDAIKSSYIKSIVTFFTNRSFKDLVFLLLFIFTYRLGEAFLSKVTLLFLKDSVENGGIGLNNEQYGLLYGTLGMLSLTIGGILGGICISRYSLRRCIIPMALALNIPDLLYVYLSIIQPNDMTVIGTCISVEQFGYGFGFTAYTVYLLQCAKGEYETVHYAFLTALMAIGMALPTIISGYWQQDIGYTEFFIRACWLTLPGMAMSIWYVLKHENKK